MVGIKADEGRSGQRGLGLLGVTLLTSLLVGTAAWAATVQCEAGQPCTGTQEADRLRGTGGEDNMDGLGGDDVLKGFGGKDRLEGGRGKDRLKGGRGADILIDDRNFDVLRGMRGHDLLIGTGDDNLSLFYCCESLFGGRGNDTLYAGVGPEGFTGDTLFGGPGSDTLLGTSKFSDVFIGGSGDDVMRGRKGLDRYMFTSDEWGNDMIFDRKDVIEDPPDEYWGNQLYLYDCTYPNLGGCDVVEGDVHISLKASDDSPEMTIEDGSSTVDWPKGAIIEWVFGGRGADTVIGSGRPERIDMGLYGGGDTVQSGGGNDMVDVLDVGTRSDGAPATVDCGAGDADHVWFDEGVDIIVNCEILHPG